MYIKAASLATDLIPFKHKHIMSYNFQATHPLIEVFGSFLDGSDHPRAFGGQCEGGPCGPNAGPYGPNANRWRHHRHGGRRGTGNSSSDAFVPAADIYSTEGEYKVYLSLPSVDKETIELTYDPNTRELVIAGTLVRPAAFAELDEEALKNVLIQGERKTGKFERKLKIPRDEGERIRFEEAAAKFDNGVLELTLPKVEKEGPKKIVIE
jgi:HSP20 family protein